MPKAAWLMLVLFALLSAVRAEADAGPLPAPIAPNIEGDRRKSRVPGLPSGYERWYGETDTVGLERGSRDYGRAGITLSTIGATTANLITAGAVPSEGSPSAAVASNLANGVPERKFSRENLPAAPAEAASVSAASPASDSAPAAPVLAVALGRRGGDKGPSCCRPAAFTGSLVKEAVGAEGDSGQLSGRNAGHMAPGRGEGTGEGGTGARDSGATRSVASVLEQVPLHSTVMYVANHGTFVRRRIPAQSRSLTLADDGKAPGAYGGGGGSGNSIPAGGDAGGRGSYAASAASETATATAASRDAKLCRTGAGHGWFTGLWVRSAGQSVRPSSQLDTSAWGEAGGSDDGTESGGSGGGDDGVNGGGSWRSRQLAQQQIQQDSAVDSASVTFNPRLACEGCPRGDPRVRVQQPNEPPFAAVGLLAQEQRRLLSGSVSQCTATLIGPRHLITAAHCVVAPDRWTFIEQVRWFAQLNTAESNIHIRSFPVRTIRVLERYIRLGSASLAALNYDFALLTLDHALPPNTFTLPIAPGKGQAVMDLETAGYPGDKPRGTMWTVRCPRVKFDFEGTELEGCGEGCENMVIHDCVSWEGQSGSAMWETAMLNGVSTAETSPPPLPPSATLPAPDKKGNNSSGNNTIRAILTGVIKFDDGTTYNVGTELNDFVYGTIATWYNEDAQLNDAQLEVPPGYQGGSPAAKINADEPESGDSGRASGSWIGDHVFVPVLIGAGGLLLLSLLVALCTLPFRLIARRRVL